MPTPHDALFKYVFSQPDAAASELRAVLPEELSKRIDWSTLKVEPGSFVDENLNDRHTDLLFGVRCRGRQAFLYVLFEHQSTSDRLMAFRLLRYCVRIWDAFLSGHPGAKGLPAIVPVVLYHGDGGWRAGTELSALLDVDAETLEALGDLVPGFRFVLEDLSDIDDQALRSRSLTAMAAAGLLLLSRGRKTPDLVRELRRWIDVFGQIAGAPHGVEALAALMEYAFRVGDVLPEDLRQFAHKVGPIAEEAFMTAAEKLTAESYEKGRAEGKAEGKAEVLVRLLVLKFGPLSEGVRQRIQAAPVAQLDTWTERVIAAESIDDVLA